MGGYQKVLVRYGPMLVPVVAAGIRHLLKKRRKDGENPADDESPVVDAVDTLVDVGLSALSQGKGAGKGRMR